MSEDKKFTSGGIVSGPQIALIGDTADRNEIILPAHLFKKSLNEQTQGIKHLIGGPHLKALSEAIEQVKLLELKPEVIHTSQPINGIRPDEPRIGVAVTTHNRPERFKKTVEALFEHCPSGFNGSNFVFAFVDDASTDTEYLYHHSVTYQPFEMHRYQFEINVGIAKAKNKALELLYDAGCDHIFLFDDDTYPIVDDWWKPYVENREPHLMYIFQHFSSGKSPHDMIKYYDDGEIAAYSHVRGCMLYYHRSVLDTVGGMNPLFGKWGHEHGDLSNRIYSAGMTRFRYMDVSNSKGLFYAADEQEHGTFTSTFPGSQRLKALQASQSVYDSGYNNPTYCEYRDLTDICVGDIDKKPLFLTAYFTTLPDPQRPGIERQFWTPDFSDYAGSVLRKGYKAMILIDNPNFTIETELVRHESVFVSVNPYFQRWISYYEYLIKNRHNISWVFMTDCTDVELLKVPEPKRGIIYTGDEPDIIGKSQWLHYHHQHPKLRQFYTTHKNVQMVNAGILGGYIEDVLPFIRAIIDTYVSMTHDMQMKGTAGPGQTDMAVFNYVAHTTFAGKISHGRHVNTVFKANERNDVSWFKHK